MLSFHFALLLLAGSPLPQPFDARVVGITDGDTVVVRYQGGPLPIRIEGIDAPERGQPFSRKARERAAGLMKDRAVRVEPWAPDTKYDRLIARIVVDGRDVSQTLVAEGLAWHYVQYSSDPRLAEAESKARAARLGLWSDPKPIAPWDWRHAAAPVGPQPRPPAGAKDSGSGSASSAGPLHGNTSSLVYHRPGCRNYWCARCGRSFATDEEARRAGFRAAGCCH